MNEPIVVMSTCSARQHMCTHYALSGKTFLLGRADTNTYLGLVKPESLLPWADIQDSLLKPLVWTGLVSSEVDNAHKDGEL